MKEDTKIVLVVGGANGIGKATVHKLMNHNYKIIVADSDVDSLESIKNKYSAQDNYLFTLPMDLSDENKVKDSIKWIKEKFGKIDFVVISAGVHSTHPVEFLDNTIIDKVMDVNLIAHIKFVRDILPIMRDGGRIIGVSSIAAGIGVPMSSMYSASKAGLEKFYESLSMEVSYRGIKPIIIHPGNVNTGFNETGNTYKPTGKPFIDDGYSRVVSRIDSRYGISPKVVAEVIIKAMTAKIPLFCYIVGANAQKAYWANRILGRNMALKLITRFFGF